MGLNSTPSGERLHIGFFGMRNAGKSSVVNAVTNQELSVVSDVKGTTTDPVYKAMELLPLGPVMIIDTPGFDDTGSLGELRVQKTKQILNKSDIAVLIVDAAAGMTTADVELLQIIKAKKIPYLVVYNKADLIDEQKADMLISGDAGQGSGGASGQGQVQGSEAAGGGFGSSQAQWRIGEDATGGASGQGSEFNGSGLGQGIDGDAGSESDQRQIEKADGSGFGSGQGQGLMNRDMESEADNKAQTPSDGDALLVSARDKRGIEALKERLAALAASPGPERHLIADLIRPGDFVVLVIPIDKAAPKGRLILPQQQVIRDILEAGAIALTVRETEFKSVFDGLSKKPVLVVTDSQVFERINKETPPDIKLTSFSLLMARYIGFLEEAVKGVAALKTLKDGDRILISEGCTHHRQCNDIGTVKLPSWIRNFTKKDFSIETSSGRGFPDDLSKYSMVIHCGGCMLTEREMQYRKDCSVDQGIPFTNYGTVIACVNGILKRSLEIFPELHKLI